MTSFTVGELRDMLSDYDDDTQVRVAIQPSYPLACAIVGIAEVGSGEEDDPEDGDWNRGENESVDEYLLRLKSLEDAPAADVIADLVAGETARENTPAVVWIATEQVGSSEHPYAPQAAWNGSGVSTGFGR
jgi:hypothetical protein